MNADPILSAADEVSDFVFLSTKGMLSTFKLESQLRESDTSLFDATLVRVAHKALDNAAQKLEVSPESVLDTAIYWRDTIVGDEVRNLIAACANGEDLPAVHTEARLFLVGLVGDHVTHYSGKTDPERIRTIQDLIAQA